MAHRAVYKTRTAEFLDDFYGGEARSRESAFADAVGLMEGSLVDAAEVVEGRYQGGLAPGSARAFHDQWLDESSRRGSQPVEAVLRHGYREAVDLARDRGVAIETFWITGAGPDFELHIVEGADRIVCFMFVPGEDDRPYGSNATRSRSWIVRAGDVSEIDPSARRAVLDDGSGPIVMIQVSGPQEAAGG